MTRRSALHRIATREKQRHITFIRPPSPASAINYTWDNNGDLTNRGSDTFAWDYEDRMTSATVNSVTTFEVKTSTD